MRAEGEKGKRKTRKRANGKHNQRKSEREGGGEEGARERGITSEITERRKLGLIYHLHIVQRALA